MLGGSQLATRATVDRELDLELLLLLCLIGQAHLDHAPFDPACGGALGWDLNVRLFPDLVLIKCLESIWVRADKLVHVNWTFLAVKAHFRRR